MKRIELDKFVVSDGFGSVDYDSLSGGYPYNKKGNPIGYIFPTVEKAIENGLKDASEQYVRMTGARVFRIVLEENDTEEAAAELSKKRAEEELKRIKENIKKLRPQDIAFIKNNM